MYNYVFYQSFEISMKKIFCCVIMQSLFYCSACAKKDSDRFL